MKHSHKLKKLLGELFAPPPPSLSLSHTHTLSLSPSLSFSLSLFLFVCLFVVDSQDNDLGSVYPSFRVWIGLWTTVFCLVMVATDASALIGFFTRFTEETFSLLISFIFIYESFDKIMTLQVSCLFRVQ